MSRKKDKNTEDDYFGEEGIKGISIGEALGIAHAPHHGADHHDEASKKQEAAGVKHANHAAAISRVSLQRQRAGRGGKTVTLVLLPQDWGGDRSELAKELRKGLGCGSSMEGDTIVLQGDICERAETWFIKYGAKKVNIG